LDDPWEKEKKNVVHKENGKVEKEGEGGSIMRQLCDFMCDECPVQL
jgi:hypothetical protein